jgi:hypothetical protein
MIAHVNAEDQTHTLLDQMPHTLHGLFVSLLVSTAPDTSPEAKTPRKQGNQSFKVADSSDSILLHLTSLKA